MSGVKTKKVFTEGPLFFRITIFAIPIMLTGILQVLYGIADNIVVGRFSGDANALASVGTTGSLVNLITTLFMGIAGGTGVVVSQYYGARNDKQVSRCVHTAMLISAIGGAIMMVFGLLVSRTALEIMGVREDIIDGAALYLRIICFGFPASLIYNFSASILRATGDSRTPLFILASTGLVNVGLNLVFVIACHMTVDGVALATIISQYLSAVAAVTVLIMRRSESYGFSFAGLCFDMPLFWQIIRCGVPAGLQSAIFGLANVVLVSAVNTLSTIAVTAYTIAGNIDGISYVTTNSFSQAASTFTGQNFGARKFDRVKTVFSYSMIQVVAFGVTMGQVLLLLADPIADFYIGTADANREQIIATTHEILGIMLNTYFLCGVMEVLSGCIRGLGYAVSPMCVSLIFACFTRLAWASFIFPLEPFNHVKGLMSVFPISWLATIVAFMILLFIAWRSLGIINGKKNSEKNENA